MNTRKWVSQNTRSTRENRNDVFLSQSLPGPSSQASLSSQRSVKNSSYREIQPNRNALQDMQEQEKMQLVSGVIRYLFAADRSKHPIQKAHIVKNMLSGNVKDYRYVLENVKTQLHTVFGYKLVEIDGNKYILVNEIKNDLPHLTFTKNASSQVLLFLVLVHIFMLGNSCKEEILWDFLRNLGIVTEDSFQHEYFGDVKQLVTIDFVNQRYLEKNIIDKNDPSKFEYKWGCRAENEITYRSALEFVANVYSQTSLNSWKSQYKAVIMHEREKNME